MAWRSSRCSSSFIYTLSCSAATVFLRTPDYKFGDCILFMSALTPLENGFTTLPWKLWVPGTPPCECHRTPEADRALLLFPRSNKRIQVSIPRGAETLPTPRRPILIHQGTRQVILPQDMQLSRHTPPTRVRARHHFLSASWPYG